MANQRRTRRNINFNRRPTRTTQIQRATQIPNKMKNKHKGFSTVSHLQLHIEISKDTLVITNPSLLVQINPIDTRYLYYLCEDY